MLTTTPSVPAIFPFSPATRYLTGGGQMYETKLVAAILFYIPYPLRSNKATPKKCWSDYTMLTWLHQAALRCGDSPTLVTSQRLTEAA